MKQQNINLVIKQKKWLILISIMVIAILGVMVMNIFDKRPFKFENFKTSEELKTFLEKRYPIGSDGNIALKDLELAGAKCHMVYDKSKLPNGFEAYDSIGWCSYYTGWLAWPPQEHYQVTVSGDKNRNIMEVFVTKHSGLVL